MISPKIHSLWIICIMLRIIISLLPFIYIYLKKNIVNQKLVTIILILNKLLLYIIGLGFIYKYFFGSNNEIQFNKVFWHNTRIIHSFIYLLAAFNFHNSKYSFSLLFIDVIFSFLYRYMNGHFKYT